MREFAEVVRPDVTAFDFYPFGAGKVPNDIPSLRDFENASAAANADTGSRRNNSLGGQVIHAKSPAVRIGLETNGEFDGGGIERVEVRMVEVAALERRRHQSRNQPKLFGFGHDVDSCVAMLDRCHGDAAAGLDVVRKAQVGFDAEQDA